MEPEGDAGTEDEGPLEPPTEEPLLQSETPSANTDLPVSLKEDLAQSSQPESHLTSQDMHPLQHLFIRKTFRPFKCTLCGKAFRDKDKLDLHLRVHGRDAYTFSCHFCTKSFVSDSALEDHLLVHTESRSYSCLLCPETFERLELLKDHVEVHSVDGYFTCPSCKKTFTDFIQVGSNSSTLVLEKIFQCPDCEKAFCRPDKLRLHMLRHSDRKDFLCSTCGKQFKVTCRRKHLKDDS
ncbi:hypothetical protein GOODEAATRI_026652 [Goodea atripinnis]|uniref:C2H2-type domain-containing protein n=1 Tax=Goodea atripinnis TaxID=208336 RepID=A0ABV0PHK8_9TELE